MKIECLEIIPLEDPSDSEALKKQLKALIDFLPTHPFPGEGVLDDKRPLFPIPKITQTTPKDISPKLPIS